MADERILVTGGAGLIGFSVAQRLAGDGRRVIATDRILPNEDGGFETVVAELTDAHKLHALTAERTRAIVHCGAVSGPMLGRDNPRAVVESNVVGTANVLEVARQRGIRVIYCSSTSAYGDTGIGTELVKEDAPLAATDIYGATKAAGDLLARAYAAQHGVDAVALRFSWVFGPRRRTPCVIRETIKDAQAGRPTALPFGRGFYRQYVYIDDVVAAILAALDVDEIGAQRAFNITGGTRLDFLEIADTIARVLPAAKITLGDTVDPDDQIHARFDISAAERALGWKPAWPFEDGVRAYADWLATQPGSGPANG